MTGRSTNQRFRRLNQQVHHRRFGRLLPERPVLLFLT
jgi:hypothetical protein